MGNKMTELHDKASTKGMEMSIEEEGAKSGKIVLMI
jgi:hypothetical protein